MKNPWIVVGVVALLLIIISYVYSSKTSDKYDENVVEPTSHVKGNPEASVTLVEYSDFQCPACASAHPVVKDVLNEFGDNIKFEFKHFPLPMHKSAVAAARAAEAAGQQGKFFEFHDMLFERQNNWSNSANPTANFAQYAEELGLDVQKFRQHMNSEILKDYIESNKDSGKELDVTGTPTFFLNGEKMQITSFADFYEQIAKTVNPDIKFDLSTKSESTAEPQI